MVGTGRIRLGRDADVEPGGRTDGWGGVDRQGGEGDGNILNRW